MKLLIILIWSVCCNFALAADEISPRMEPNGSLDFLTNITAAASDLIIGPGALREQLDLSLTDATASIGRNQCPECDRAIKKIEDIILMFGEDGPLVVSERIALDIFERFQVMLLYLPRPTQMYRAPEGRFFYNYLINLFKFVIKDHAFADHRELVDRVFAGENANLKCGLVISLKLEEKDIPWLLHQAALPENSPIRSCLAEKLIPRLSPRAQMALASRLWHVSSPPEQKRLQINLSRAIEALGQIEKHEPLLRWLVEQNHPELSTIVQSVLKKEGIEKLPNLVQRLFDLAGNNNLDLIETLGGRLCEPQLQSILFNLIDQGTFWQRTLLVSQVMSQPRCYDDRQIMGKFIQQAENYSLLATAQYLLPKVKNQREVAALILEKIDWKSDTDEEIVMIIFMLETSLEWRDLLDLQLARLSAIDPRRAEHVLERVLRLKPWGEQPSLMVTPTPCDDLLANRSTSN